MPLRESLHYVEPAPLLTRRLKRLAKQVCAAASRAERDVRLLELVAAVGRDDYDAQRVEIELEQDGPEAFAKMAAGRLAQNVPDLTREELIDIVARAQAAVPPAQDYYLALLDRNVPMSGASSLLFHPPGWRNGDDVSAYDPSPEDIVAAATAPNQVIQL